MVQNSNILASGSRSFRTGLPSTNGHGSLWAPADPLRSIRKSPPKAGPLVAVAALETVVPLIDEVSSPYTRTFLL